MRWGLSTVPKLAYATLSKFYAILSSNAFSVNKACHSAASSSYFIFKSLIGGVSPPPLTKPYLRYFPGIDNVSFILENNPKFLFKTFNIIYTKNIFLKSLLFR